MSITLQYDMDGEPTFPGSIISDWQEVPDVSPESQDNSGTVNNPDSDITDVDDRIFVKPDRAGTNIRARLKYDDGLSGITDPIVCLWGRKGDGGKWQRLSNAAGNTSITLETDAISDARDGTYKYTHPNRTTHTWDCDGCDQFAFAILTALAGTGTVNTSTLEVKVI